MASARKNSPTREENIRFDTPTFEESVESSIKDKLKLNEGIVTPKQLKDIN